MTPRRGSQRASFELLILRHLASNAAGNLWVEEPNYSVFLTESHTLQGPGRRDGGDIRYEHFGIAIA